jgi:hypothetical protein
MNNRPDIKVMQNPGGKSNFSFGWSKDEPQQKKELPKKIDDVKKEDEEEEKKKKIEEEELKKKIEEEEEEKKKKQVHTSIKLHAPPGGKSNFTFG